MRVTPDMLSVIAAEFEDPKVGLATCPYRAVPGFSLWSTLEALGLNTEFIGGVLVARMLDGMKFALGPTIAARRGTLEAIGGFDAVKDYLAEDFVHGEARGGARHRRDSFVVRDRAPHRRAATGRRICATGCGGTAAPGARVRLGYFGQLFTHPLPLAAHRRGSRRRGGAPVAVAAIVLRVAAAVGSRNLRAARPADVAILVAGAVQDTRVFWCGSADSSGTPFCGAAVSIICCRTGALN